MPKSLVRKTFGIAIRLTVFTALLVGTVFFAVKIWIPIKDTLWGPPYQLKTHPDNITKHGFQLNITVPCNRFFEREIGFIIDPPLYSDEHIRRALDGLTGKASVTIKQGKKTKTETIIFPEIGHGISDGLWIHTILRYEPFDRIFCINHNISLTVSNLDFNLEEHDIQVYLSRDLRP